MSSNISKRYPHINVNDGIAFRKAFSKSEVEVQQLLHKYRDIVQKRYRLSPESTRKVLLGYMFADLTTAAKPESIGVSTQMIGNIMRGKSFPKKKSKINLLTQILKKEIKALEPKASPVLSLVEDTTVSPYQKINLLTQILNNEVKAFESRDSPVLSLVEDTTASPLVDRETGTRFLAKIEQMIY